MRRRRTLPVVGVFVVVNLFIAVVINNLESAKLEHQTEADRQGAHGDVLRAIGEMRDRLEHLERLLRATDTPSTPRGPDRRPRQPSAPDAGLD